MLSISTVGQKTENIRYKFNGGKSRVRTLLCYNQEFLQFKIPSSKKMATLSKPKSKPSRSSDGYNAGDRIDNQTHIRRPIDNQMHIRRPMNELEGTLLTPESTTPAIVTAIPVPAARNCNNNDNDYAYTMAYSVVEDVNEKNEEEAHSLPNAMNNEDTVSFDVAHGNVVGRIRNERERERIEIGRRHINSAVQGEANNVKKAQTNARLRDKEGLEILDNQCHHRDGALEEEEQRRQELMSGGGCGELRYGNGQKEGEGYETTTYNTSDYGMKDYEMKQYDTTEYKSVYDR